LLFAGRISLLVSVVLFNQGRPLMTSESSVPRLLRFKDLLAKGIVLSHAGLRHLQLHEGFPLGRLLGPSTRVWSETEIAEWLANRPIEQSRQTRERAQRSIEARKTAREMLDLPAHEPPFGDGATQ
jgi:predicted DNA-binding transcriptional regulator AlpA